MKLSLLYEDEPLASKLMNAMSGPSGSPHGGSWFKKQQDPLNPEANLAGPSKKFLPSRSGNQDTPMKGRHRRYFNSPASGKSSKPGFSDNKPLGSTAPAHDPAPSGEGSWGKRPGVRDI